MPANKDTIERRSIIVEGIGIEKRAKDDDDDYLVGYAVLFDQRSQNLGWFYEEVDAMAFEGADLSDVVALFNHNSDNILGRTTNTLELTIDEIGLRYKILLPKTSTANDLIESVKRKDIKGSSFQFRIKEDEWFEEGENTIRKITKFEKLFDVGPVTFPAYLQTNVAKRSFDAYEKANKPQVIPISVLQKQIELIKL